MIASGRVSWFKLDKKFGFVELEEGIGDAFLHVSVLKAAGYVTIPAGSTLRVRLDCG
jgi:CspA family cold shock protein